MNELILPIIFAVSLGFVAGVIAPGNYNLDSQSKKQPIKEKNKIFLLFTLKKKLN